MSRLYSPRPPSYPVAPDLVPVLQANLSLRLQAPDYIAAEREQYRNNFGKIIAVFSQSAVKQLGECGIVDFGIMAPVNRYAMHGYDAVDFKSRHTFRCLSAIVSEFPAGCFEYEYTITVFFY